MVVYTHVHRRIVCAFSSPLRIASPDCLSGLVEVSSLLLFILLLNMVDKRIRK